MRGRAIPQGDPTPSRNERGFAMLAVVLVLLGIGMTFILSNMRERIASQSSAQTQTFEQLTVVDDALAAYALTTRRLPCPANGADADGVAETSCITGTQNNGILPWRTLGLKESDAIDRWGRMIAYRVDPALTSAPITSASSAQIIVCRTRTNCTQPANQVYSDAAYVLISTGPAGQGGYLPDWDEPLPAPRSAEEQANLGTPPSAAPYTFYDLPFNIMNGKERRAPDNEDYFDDVVLARSISDLAPPAVAGTNEFDLDNPADLELVEGTKDYKDASSGRNTKKPIVGDDPTGDGNAVAFGDGDETQYRPLQETGQTSCFWVDKPFKFTTKSFRAYFKFQFFPGQVADDEYGTGDGFTFTLVTGDSDITDPNTGVVCGKSGHHQDLGYSFGPRMPKMAVEFDIYNNGHGREIGLHHNHAAILLAWDDDEVGNAVGNNPDCKYFHLSTYGSENPCTFRRAVDGFGPPNKNFLEERSTDTFPYIAGGLGAVPYPVRIEIERGCDLTCGTCGQSRAADFDPTTDTWPNTYMRTKVWIRCEEESCADTSQTFTGAWTANSINYCHKDPSEYDNDDDTTFDKIKFGFTMGTKGDNIGVLITDLKASTK